MKFPNLKHILYGTLIGLTLSTPLFSKYIDKTPRIQDSKPVYKFIPTLEVNDKNEYRGIRQTDRLDFLMEAMELAEKSYQEESWLEFVGNDGVRRFLETGIRNKESYEVFPVKGSEEMGNFIYSQSVVVDSSPLTKKIKNQKIVDRHHIHPTKKRKKVPVNYNGKTYEVDTGFMTSNSFYIPSMGDFEGLLKETNLLKENNPGKDYRVTTISDKGVIYMYFTDKGLDTYNQMSPEQSQRVFQAKRNMMEVLLENTKGPLTEDRLERIVGACSNSYLRMKFIPRSKIERLRDEQDNKGNSGKETRYAKSKENPRKGWAFAENRQTRRNQSRRAKQNHRNDFTLPNVAFF